MQCKATQSRATQSKAKQSRAGQSEAQNVVVRCHSFCGDQGFCCCSNHTPSSCEAAGVLQRPAQEKLKETSSRTQHPLWTPRGPCPKRVKLQHWDGQGGHLSDVAAFCFFVTATYPLLHHYVRMRRQLASTVVIHPKRQENLFR